MNQLQPRRHHHRTQGKQSGHLCRKHSILPLRPPPEHIIVLKERSLVACVESTVYCHNGHLQNTTSHSKGSSLVSCVESTGYCHYGPPPRTHRRTWRIHTVTHNKNWWFRQQNVSPDQDALTWIKDRTQDSSWAEDHPDANYSKTVSFPYFHIYIVLILAAKVNIPW